MKQEHELTKLKICANVLILSLLLLYMLQTNTSAQGFHKYYMFENYYNNTRISLLFGEAEHLNSLGDMEPLALKYILQDTEGSILCCANSNNLADSSFTSSFTANEGSSLKYYLGSILQYADSRDSIDIADTVMIIMQLIDVNNGNVVAQVDSVGFYPCMHADSMFASIVSKDTNIIRTYAIPNDLIGNELAIRIYPNFSGHDSSNYMCRESLAREWLLSDEERESRNTLYELLDVVWSDTTLYNLVILNNPTQISSTDLSYLAFNISPNPASSRTDISFNVDDFADGWSGRVEVYSFDGRRCLVSVIPESGHLTMDLSSMSPGKYLIVPFVGNKMYYGRPLVIVR